VDLLEEDSAIHLLVVLETPLDWLRRPVLTRFVTEVLFESLPILLERRVARRVPNKRVLLACFVNGGILEGRVGESASPVLTKGGFRVEDCLLEPTYHLSPDILRSITLLFSLDHPVID
jgi:hypothetical protein